MYLFSYFAFREGGIRILLSYCNRSRERNNVSDHVSLKVPTEIRILAQEIQNLLLILLRDVLHQMQERRGADLPDDTILRA